MGLDSHARRMASELAMSVFAAVTAKMIALGCIRKVYVREHSPFSFMTACSHLLDVSKDHPANLIFNIHRLIANGNPLNEDINFNSNNISFSPCSPGNSGQINQCQIQDVGRPNTQTNRIG